MIDVQSGSKSKSVSFDISSTSLSTFIHSSTPTITMADPGKRQISIWPLEQATKQPPRRLSEFSSMFPEGTTTKLVDLRHDDEWVVITELVQWPVLRAAFPQFHAGLMRTVRIRDGEARDMWGFAGAVVDVPVTGQWVKMFCFADRADPKAGVSEVISIDSADVEPAEFPDAPSLPRHFFSNPRPTRANRRRRSTILLSPDPHVRRHGRPEICSRGPSKFNRRRHGLWCSARILRGRQFDGLL